MGLKATPRALTSVVSMSFGAGNMPSPLFATSGIVVYVALALDALAATTSDATNASNTTATILQDPYRTEQKNAIIVRCCQWSMVARRRKRPAGVTRMCKGEVRPRTPQ